jgi:hypothetical protein
VGIPLCVGLGGGARLLVGGARSARMCVGPTAYDCTQSSRVWQNAGCTWTKGSRLSADLRAKRKFISQDNCTIDGAARAAARSPDFARRAVLFPRAPQRLFTEDGLFVTDAGPVYGREAIQKWYEDLFQQLKLKSMLAHPIKVAPHTIGTSGNEVWENGEWSETIQLESGDLIEIKGYWSTIDRRRAMIGRSEC